MGSRIKKKAIPLIATTVLATTAFTTQAFINDGNAQKVEANEFQRKNQNKIMQAGSLVTTTYIVSGVLAGTTLQILQHQSEVEMPFIQL